MLWHQTHKNELNIPLWNSCRWNRLPPFFWVETDPLVDVDPGRPLHLYHFASAKSHSALHGLSRSLKIGKLHNFVKSFYVEFEYSLHNPTYVMLVTLVTFVLEFGSVAFRERRWIKEKDLWDLACSWSAEVEFLLDSDCLLQWFAGIVEGCVA